MRGKTTEFERSLGKGPKPLLIYVQLFHFPPRANPEYTTPRKRKINTHCTTTKSLYLI